MYTPWETVDVNYNVVKLLNGRERKPEAAKKLKQNFQFTGTLLKKLGLEKELDGHQGCVNCLQWSADGKILASGSDDMSVILWDPFRYRSLKVLPTRHVGNIFSVKFLGDGSLIATGAGDTRVIVQSVEGKPDNSLHLNCGCHLGRVKRLVTDPNQPIVFWSASEDGLVIQYDMRESHECTVKSKVFIDLSYTSELKCIAVNPTKPQYIAVGANDCFVRMYDRRMVKTTNYRASHTFDFRKRVPPEPQDPACVQYYASGHLAKDNGGDFLMKLAVTYIAFNAAGSEMLVNMGGDHIYLFDINNPRHINELRVPEHLPKKKQKFAPNECCLSPDKGKAQRKSEHKHNYKIASKAACACDYLDRASRLYKRRWVGDIYAAARDYLYAIQLWSDADAYMGLVNCLVALKWKEEAQKWLNCFEKCKPDIDKSVLASLQEQVDHCQEPGVVADGLESLNDIDISDDEKLLRGDSFDYELRFLGHCNTTTDIKEANFLGEEGDFICAGSDDGMIFIWDRRTTNVLTALVGDMSIVNCVQPHPSACFIASSGIDPVVKLWSPLPDNIANQNVVTDIWTAVEANQERMSMDPFETMLANMGYHVRDSDGSHYHQIPTCRTS